MLSPSTIDRPIRPKASTTYSDMDPALGESEDAADRERGGAGGGALERFPPGQHPLEGVSNLADLGSPEELAGKSR
jgi:hypothetical protein